MRFILLVMMLPLLAACGLPSAGPGASQVIATADTTIPPYDLIPLNASIADSLAAHEHQNLAAAFGEGGGAPDLRIGVGDVVVVTIFEAASGGLFSGDAGTLGAASKSVSLPPQPVARNGTITVPFVGQVKAAGLTPAQVQANVEAGLRDKAIEPQVIVTVAENASTFVTVAGDVGRPGRVPLGLDGDRLLDAIAVAGGSRAPAYDSFVRLTRGGSTPVTVGLALVVDDPGQNIYLRPDDQIFVVTDPQIFTAFGATARNATFPFGTGRLTLAEAVGRAGGLLDSRADASGVFVFRYERPELYARIRDGAAPSVQAAGVPVVYQLNMKDPNGYFVAQRFLMRDNDIIYVSSAPSTDVQKFLGLIGAGVGIAGSGLGLADAVNDLSNN